MKNAISFAFACILFVCVFQSQSVFAQRFTSNAQPRLTQAADTSVDEDAERAYLALKAGNLDDARKYLDEADSSDPFAMYVRAALMPDAVGAADLYKEIVADNENRPIAREALLQLYKYHFAAGNYGAAHTDYLELHRYPMTPKLIDPIGFEDSLQTPAPLVKKQVTQTFPSVNAPAVESGNFAVQVGVFSTLQNARRFVASLQSKGIDGTIFTKADGDRKLYAVSAGSFPTRGAAQDFAADLKSRSIDCIVVER